jgi:hypothetical protein
MGYETKMLVVIKSPQQTQTLAMISEIRINKKDESIVQEIFQCYKEHDGSYTYYPKAIKTPLPSGAIIKEGPWCRVIAMLDFSKAGTWPGICKFEDSDGHYAYNPFDGNKVLGLDGYGYYRKFVPLQDVIEILQNNINYSKENNRPPYYLFMAALGLLEGLKDNVLYNDMGCLFYGH